MKSRQTLEPYPMVSKGTCIVQDLPICRLASRTRVAFAFGHVRRRAAWWKTDRAVSGPRAARRAARRARARARHAARRRSTASPPSPRCRKLALCSRSCSQRNTVSHFIILPYSLARFIVCWIQTRPGHARYSGVRLIYLSSLCPVSNLSFDRGHNCIFTFSAQSLYKLNSEEGTSTDPTKSPIRRAQPSPIGSDVMSPHQVSTVPMILGNMSWYVLEWSVRCACRSSRCRRRRPRAAPRPARAARASRAARTCTPSRSGATTSRTASTRCRRSSRTSTPTPPPRYNTKHIRSHLCISYAICVSTMITSNSSGVQRPTCVTLIKRTLNSSNQQR